MKKLLALLAVALTLPFSGMVQAQPGLDRSKTIEIVVPFAPGGAGTVMGQLVAKILKDQGYTAVVINRPGNSAIIGINSVAKANADGYTLLIGPNGMVINLANRNIMTGMEYNEKSFVPIALLNMSATGMAINAKDTIKNYEQFKFYVKANPDKFNFGVLTVTYTPLVKEWARKEGLPEPQIILYKGSSDMTAGIAGGTLLAGFDNFGYGAPALPLVKADRLRLIATLDNSVTKEVGKLPYPVADISKAHPDLKENIWIGLWAPTGTPQSIVLEINKMINAAINDPRYKDQIAEMDGFGGKPEVLSNLYNRSLALHNRLAKTAAPAGK